METLGIGILAIITFVIATVSSAFINWILIKFSINLGVRNISAKDEIRWQKRKPSVGGLSFYLVFLILFIILFIIISSNIFKIESSFNSSLALILSVSSGFFVGLIDDAKNTNPLLKFMGQVLCGIIIVLFGIHIPLSTNIVWNSIFTIFWVVFLMNSINMLDNMDGMSSLISVLIFAAMMYFVKSNYDFISLMIAVCIGSIIGFLYYNWHPSRIYMGDSGSQFLGITLAFFSTYILWQYRASNGGYFQVRQFFLPAMIFTIPIFDTTTVFIHRIWRRQSPFIGGKDHLSHHLVFLGLKDYVAVSLLGLINSIFIFIGIIIMEMNFNHMFWAILFWLVSFGVVQFFYIKAKPIALAEAAKNKQ